MTLVDAYYIPDDLSESYIKDREKYAQKAKQIFKNYVDKVVRDLTASTKGWRGDSWL